MGSLPVVFDTNVLISAIGFGGTPLEALLRAFDDDVAILASGETLDELDRVMGYEHLPFTDDEREQYLAVLSDEIELVTPEPGIEVVERDPDDDAFLACAVAGDAAYVVSGDDHLLELGSYRGIGVVTPAEFVRQMP